jgi:hypothetical protein
VYSLEVSKPAVQSFRIAKVLGVDFRGDLQFWDEADSLFTLPKGEFDFVPVPGDYFFFDANGKRRLSRKAEFEREYGREGG